MAPTPAVDESAKLQELRELVSNKKDKKDQYVYSEEQRAWMTDECLHRYLRARNWNVKKSAKMLEETLKWRWDYKPHLLTDDDLATQIWTGSNYLNGHDKEGHPCIVMRVALDPPGTQDEKVRYLIYSLERALRAMPVGVEKWCVIVDLKEFSMSQHGDIKVSGQFVKILQSHYPERLARFVCVNAPKVFVGFWRLVSTFVDDVTKKKFEVLGIDTTKEDMKKYFLQYFSEDQLEEDFGGTLKSKIPEGVHEKLVAVRSQPKGKVLSHTNSVPGPSTNEATNQNAPLESHSAPVAQRVVAG
eukprot:comp20534_c0_seq1/m.26325 comp20534_c0_seq1/g.26325  ORF comp20534_c0_seq1/g.26325 comp20534_c0_seq1/m.26325 type:complete len:301 (-) comp20534_c0_seq1:319-1221(-)